MSAAAKIFVLLALALCASSAYGQQATMTMKSGRVVDLTKISNEAKGKCCFSAQELGLKNVDGDNTIARMDGSGGRYFVTNDPNCGNVITSSAYSTSFDYLYVCGMCKGGVCPQVDGGKTVVQKGGSCVKADGSYDVMKQCVSSAPVCMSPGSGTCVTIAESQAKPTAPAPAPTPTPSAPACASFSNLGGPCDAARSICCGGGPKNAKCENGICVTTFPTGRRMGM